MKGLVEKFRAIGMPKEGNDTLTEYVDTYNQARDDGRKRLDTGEWASFVVEKRYKLEEVGGATKD